MKCSEIRDKLMDYAADELPPPEMEDVRAHISSCEGCRAELAIAERASDALLLLNAEDPVPDLIGAVRQRLDREQACRSALMPRLAWAYTAALVCMLAITGWLIWRPGAQQINNIARQPRKAQPPVVANKTVPTPAPAPAVREPEPQPVKHTAPRHVAIRQPQAQPRAQRTVAVKPKVNGRVVKPIPAPAIHELSPRPDEPEIRMAVSPREPESFVVQVGDEEPSTSAELTVVRHFDVGGNIRAVTITNKPRPADNDKPDSIIPGNTQLPGVEAPGSQESATTRFGGNTTNA